MVEGIYIYSFSPRCILHWLSYTVEIHLLPASSSPLCAAKR